ncbi:hypothetical protein [Hymenobacter sp. AT01-02]|uniref:hypothetical protein n=1 Tax=Hymenobacter sp. AT01-02 TaxID=1571877 RepID=UPI0005F0E3F7|nr:hypothetical protein [Hymenobacter sp. AT01-02]
MAATKNDIPTSTPNLVWLLLGLAVVAAVRLYGLQYVALPDYDSVRNWQIVQEIAHGNLRHLFHHGSPGFSFLYAPVAWITTNFQVFQHLNALLGVAALGVLMRFVAQEARLVGWQLVLLTVFTGTSVFLTFSGRDFTMSSGSLLCFAGLVQAHYRRLQHPSRQALLRTTGWLVAGLCLNYKFILTIPILAVLELWHGDGLLWNPGTLGRIALLLLAPYIVLGIVGVLAGLPWYLWPAVYYKVAFPDVANAAGRATTFRLDGLYYPRYLRDFESPALWPGLLLGLLGLRRWLPKWRTLLPIQGYLAVWATCLVLGMSLLLKAPRGLLWAYPLFYTLAFLGLRRLPTWAFGSVVAVAIAWNTYRLQQEIFDYAPTRYPQVAAWLQAHGGARVASTVSLGLAPFLPATDTVLAITDEKQLATLRRRGFRYVLLDGYWRVTGIARFDSLQQQRPVAAWPEPLLTAPLLFLEHSEYTGLGYLETIKRQQIARQDSLQLRLFVLP